MIRPARTTDYDAFATLHRELGLEEVPPSRERFITDIVHSTWVDDGDGRVDGYVQFHTLGTIGYVRQLVVSQDARGRGKGAGLMRHAAASLRSAGVAGWTSCRGRHATCGIGGRAADGAALNRSFIQKILVIQAPVHLISRISCAIGAFCSASSKTRPASRNSP